MTKYIRVKFLKGGKPHGHAYTYRIEEAVEIGDAVITSEERKGVVVRYDEKPRIIYGVAKKVGDL